MKPTQSVLGLQTLAFCAAAAAALSLASCTVGRSRSIKVSMPASSSSVAQVSTGASSSMNVAAPGAFSGFSCFALNVRGPGIAPDGPLCHGNPAVGKLSNFAPFNGGTVEIKVPPGPARTIQLIGVMTGDGSCPSYDQLLNYNSPISTFDLGQKTVDVFNDVNVTMRAQYDPANPVETLMGCGEGGGGMGPTPDQIPGLVVWHAAESMVPALANNALVNNWPDLSAGNIDSVASNPNEPILQHGVLNGQAGVVFDGIDDFMFLGSVAAPQFDSADGTYTAIVVASYPAVAATQPFFNLDFSAPGAVAFGMNASAGFLPQGYGADNVLTQIIATGSTNSAGGGPKIFSAVLRADQVLSLYVNGTFDGSVGGVTSPSYTALAGTSYIGRKGINYSSMTLGELIIYNRALSDAERQSLECSLNGLYGIGTLPFACGP